MGGKSCKMVNGGGFVHRDLLYWKGEESKAPATFSYAKTDDGYCLISQMYYDEEDDNIRLCSLYFKEDMSYGVIRWDDQEILYKGSE